MQLRFWRFDLRLTRPWRIAGSGLDGMNTYPVVLLELVDAQGRRGLGEAASTTRYAQPVEVLEDFLGKVDARQLSFDDIPGSMQGLEAVAPGHAAAKCGLNLALLDAAARAAQKPIYDWLELGFREHHHRTSFSIGLDTPAVIREKVRAAERFPVLKLKMGSPEDRRNFSALREAAPRKPVRVDANEGWATKEEALRAIEWLHQDGHVELVEQPMPAAVPVADWIWLKQRSPLPIFGDESYHTAADVARAADCFHGVNVKLVKAGGINGAYDALQAARRAGLRTMIGCMIESSLLISAAAHLAELADHLDLDGNLLIRNDPCRGVTAEQGTLSFGQARELFGLRAEIVSSTGG